MFVPCSTHAQCDPSCVATMCIPTDPYFPGCDALCIGGQCIDTHASKVASVVSATRQGTPWSAAHASLYFANGLLNACDKNETQQAFDWFVANDVTIVNESYSCAPNDDVGQVEDFYSFIWDINITKSAGNEITATACPNHLDAICVGATDHTLAMASYSTWQNPATLFGGSYDREEPDVAALGGGGGTCTSYDSVNLLGYQSATDWGGAGAGTSFSAPIVAAMLTLLQEKCGGPGGGHLQPLAARAAMAQVAWAVDPDGPFPAGWWYSTPAQGKDNKDGAGFDLADLLGCPGGSVTTIDLTQGVLGPNGNSYPPPGGPPPQSFELHPQSSGIPPGPADGRLYRQLAAWSFPNGGRLRYSIHWDACAIDPLGLPQAAVVPDFDLFLFDRTRERHHYASQSNDDNNEGFDVTISATAAGQYEVWLAWPNGAQGCMGPWASFAWESVPWGGQ